jgi:hypothetical protein
MLNAGRVRWRTAGIEVADDQGANEIDEDRLENPVDLSRLAPIRRTVTRFAGVQTSTASR